MERTTDDIKNAGRNSSGGWPASGLRMVDDTVRDQPSSIVACALSVDDNHQGGVSWQ